MRLTTQKGDFEYECVVSRAIVDLFIVLAVHDNDDEVKIKRNSVKLKK